MLKKITSLLLSLCLSAAAVSGLTVTASAAETRSEDWGEYRDGWYHISNADQLVALAEVTKETSHPSLSANIVLDNDITLSPYYDKKINIASDSTNPFRGVFDGNGHTINNLTYSFHSLCSGLFGYTEGATIKNLNIENADIYMVNSGGIIAGYAKDTDFINISIKNGHLDCISGGVAIELITADGITAGAITGHALNQSHIYNCESVNTVIEPGGAEGVTALGGDGYYMGGLVGTLSQSYIEYSRTISEGSTASGSLKFTSTTAISALNFKNIYLGGIAGELSDGAGVIDSFSNITIVNEPKIAAGVVSGVYAYTGGIAGSANGPHTYVGRCHYSGKIEACDYDAVVLAAWPAREDRHIGGVVGNIEDDADVDTRFVNCYYNYDRIIEGKKISGISRARIADGWEDPLPYYEMDFATCNSYTESQYGNDDLWINEGFDFEGTILRDTPCNELFVDNGNNGHHVNQWVMDTYNYTNVNDTAYATTTMPIHASANVNIYSNINNAFDDSDPVRMQYNYAVTDNETVVLPNENKLTQINPNLHNSGFIGIAFVSRTNGNDTCDYLYLPGTEVDANVFEKYGIDPDKRIYAVWCQAKTLGAQLGLNAGNEGLRVLTAVNTDLLDNIGLDLPDDEYGRGATFTVNNETYLIEATSKTWIGEQYRVAFGVSDLNNEVANAKVFSIFAVMDEGDYDKDITYSGDILWFGNNANGTEAVFDFICNSDTYPTSVSDIAERYLSDLEASGASEAENYGLTDEQYGVLKQYID